MRREFSVGPVEVLVHSDSAVHLLRIGRLRAYWVRDTEHPIHSAMEQREREIKARNIFAQRPQG